MYWGVRVSGNNCHHGNDFLMFLHAKPIDTISTISHILHKINVVARSIIVVVLFSCLPWQAIFLLSFHKFGYK